MPKGPSTRLTTGLDAHTLSISTHNLKLAYSDFNYTSNVWSIKVPNIGFVSSSEAEPITMGNQIVESMDISHDGQWLAYDSNLSGNMDIYKMPVAGADAIQLTSHPNDDFIPCWSPDGEHIVFHSFRNGNRDVFSMTKDGRNIQALTDEPSHERSPDWSFDTSKVVYFSDITGRNELFVVARNDTGWGEPQQLTFDGGIFPKWSPVDNNIVYISNDVLKVISYEDEKIQTLVQTQDDISFAKPKYPAWSLDGETVFYTAMDRQTNCTIWAVPVKGGESELKVIFDDPYKWLGLFNFSTDSQKFYFSIRVNESNVWTMDLISQD